MRDIEWSVDEFLDEALDWELWRRASELALREDETASWLNAVNVGPGLPPVALSAIRGAR